MNNPFRGITRVPGLIRKEREAARRAEVAWQQQEAARRHRENYRPHVARDGLPHARPYGGRIERTRPRSRR